MPAAATPKIQPGVWTTVPQRRFQDYVSPNTAWAAEAMRETFLRIGLATLESSAPVALFFPPRKAHSPKQAAGNKDLHRNRYVEIGVVMRGEMTIWWEGVTTRCGTGSVFVIPPGIRYMPHVQPPEQAGQTPPHSVIWLAVHKSYAVAHMCTLEGNRHLLTEYYSFVDASLATQARLIAQELSDRASHFETAIRGSLLCLFTGLSRAPAQPLSQFDAPTTESPERDGSKDNSPDDFGERVRSYLLSHYHRPLTLPQVAGAVGCSPSYLCRRFRELTGETPFHFLRDVRVEAAKRLLHSGVPVARIAEMTGFDDPLYFSKVFARQVGASPQKFRAREKAKASNPNER